MEKLILHRNYGSPYCEKIIALLGYTKLVWYSELTSKGMPRPVQETLVGNYARRVPILQIGADFYCDTKEITSILSELSKQPELSFHLLSTKEQNFNYQLEHEFGKAVVATLSPKDLILSYFKHIPPKHALEFLVDRFKLKKRFAQTRGSRTKEEWFELLSHYFFLLEGKLNKHIYLSGKELPNYTDFTAFTHVWYSERINQLRHATHLQLISSWLNRMKQFSHNSFTSLPKGEAIQIAKNCSPTTVPANLKQSERIQKKITLKVNDSLASIMEPIEGILVGEDSSKYILKRSNLQIGNVHLHLPKTCFGACA